VPLSSGECCRQAISEGIGHIIECVTAGMASAEFSVALFPTVEGTLELCSSTCTEGVLRQAFQLLTRCYGRKEEYQLWLLDWHVPQLTTTCTSCNAVLHTLLHLCTLFLNEALYSHMSSARPVCRVIGKQPTPSTQLARIAQKDRRLFDKEAENHHAEPLLLSQLASRCLAWCWSRYPSNAPACAAQRAASLLGDVMEVAAAEKVHPSHLPYSSTSACSAFTAALGACRRRKECCF
jgi:hypothetical protein